MKTIKDHNDLAWEILNKTTELSMAGVLCDDCYVEMFYPTPTMILASIPPKMTVQCPKCHKIDYKIR